MPGVGLSPGMVDQYEEDNHVLPLTGVTCNPERDLSVSATTTDVNSNRDITVSVTVQVNNVAFLSIYLFILFVCFLYFFVALMLNVRKCSKTV